MISNYGFRINKYLKVSLAIGMIDLLIFYIIGRTFNYMELFHTITNKWKYIMLFISSILLIIYFFDVLFFCNRNRKYKFLLIFEEPFKNWQKYIDKDVTIKNAHKKYNFYSDIFYKVKNNDKIKGIRDDDVLIRDIVVHLISTNLVILFFFFLLEHIQFKIIIYCFVALVCTYILMSLAYRNYLKYYINEIYKEFLNNL